jgi:hypothetical protein
LDENNFLDNDKLTIIGGTIDLETPPSAINVELYPDFLCDDILTAQYKKRKKA